MLQKTKPILWLAVLLCCAFSLIITITYYDNFPRGYELMPLLPVLYSIAFLFFYRLLFTTDYKITTTAYFAFQFLRLVITPAVIALGGAAVGSHLSWVSSDALSLATLLIIVEFLVVSAFIAIWGQRRIKNQNTAPLHLAGSSIAYVLFACLAVLIFFFYKRQGIQLVYFISLPPSQDGRIGDLTDTVLVLAKQIVTLAISFLFLVVVNRNQRLNLLHHRNKYSNWAILAALLVVCVIVGERRSRQIYTAIISCYILIRAFPERKFKIVALICSVAVSIFLVMSIYKMFAAFYYGSYSEALRQANWGMADFASLLQSYFAGPRNVALAIDFGRFNKLEFGQVLFDLGRSTVPISFLLKSSGLMTTTLMNNFIYHGTQDAGHVLAASGYSYIFGGIPVCWLSMLINIAICFFAERQMRTAKSFEAVYIFLTVLLRFGLNFTANTPSLWSAATNHLFTAGIAFGAAILIKKVVNIHADNDRLLRHC